MNHEKAAKYDAVECAQTEILDSIDILKKIIKRRAEAKKLDKEKLDKEAG